MATTPIKLNDLRATALIDSGASSSFVNSKFVLKHTLRCQPHYESTCLASKDFRANEIGTIAFDVVCQDQLYSNVLFNVMDELCADVILGQDFMKLLEKLIFETGGSCKPLLIDKEMTTIAVLFKLLLHHRVFFVIS